MSKPDFSSLDDYNNSAFKLFVWMTPIMALFLQIFCTLIFYGGRVSCNNEVLLWIANFLTIAAALFCLAIYHKAFKKDRTLNTKVAKNARIVLLIFGIVEYIFMSLAIPSINFLPYSALLVLLQITTLDVGMVCTNCLLMVVSSTAVAFVRGSLYKSAILTEGEIVIYMCSMIFLVISMLVVVLSRTCLYQVVESYSNYDTMTHLLNRRSLDDTLEDAHGKAKAGKETFCLMMISIDDLQSVKDKYGYVGEESVLKYVASTISTGVKKDDKVFRLDEGEVLVLLKTDEYRTKSAAERIRKDVAKDPVVLKDGTEIGVTITIGIAPYRNGISVQQMINEADLKLYYGKRNGQNLVIDVLSESDQKTESMEEQEVEQSEEEPKAEQSEESSES